MDKKRSIESKIKTSISIKKSWKDPLVRERHRIGAINSWKNLIIRRNRLTKMRSLEVHNKMSSVSLQNWKRPEYRSFILSKLHSKEAKKKQLKFLKEHPPRKGLKTSNETKIKMRLKKIGRKLTEEHKQKISDSGKGRIGWWLGKKFSDEHKNKIKQALNMSAVRQRIVNARRRQVFPLKDTKIEVALQEELKNLNIDFQTHIPIVGQPDIFIEPNICIFCDGDYWHSRPKSKEHGAYVVSQLKESGYKVLRFWEHEIKGNLPMCLAKIKSCMEENN